MSNIREEFSRIYDEYIEKIYRFVFFKVNSQEIAEDLTSETFMKCWERYKDKRDDIDNLQAFLYQIARNLVTDHYREKGRTKTISLDCVPILDPRPNLEEKAEDNLEMENIKLALTNLKDDYQDLITWYYIEDLSIPEISRISGKSEGNVRVAIHRALNSLKDEIKKNRGEA